MNPEQTSPSASWARAVAAAGLLLLLFAGLATNLRAVLVHKLDLFSQPVSWPAFLDGKVTAGIGHALSAARLPTLAARWQRGLAWEVMGDLGPRVRTGCDGWLFLADELRVYPDGDEDMRKRAQILAQVRDGLATRGIDLLVVTVPDKSRMEAQHLCHLSRPGVLEQRLQAWAALLKAYGVENLDLQAPIRQLQQRSGYPLFLMADTHWNEDGARAAADATAHAVLAKMTPLPHQLWQTTHSALQHRDGDLVHLAGLEGGAWHRPLPFDRVSISSIQASAQAIVGDGKLDEEALLFGESQVPNIALIGTSYSNTSNFIGFLEQRLHAPIGHFAKDGGDFAGAAHDYFAGVAFRENPPRLLIWEIPERVLQSARAGDQDIGWPQSMH